EARVVVKEHPAQVVELERREKVGVFLQFLRQLDSVFADGLRRPWLDLGDEGETITRRGPGPDGAVSPHFKVFQLLGDRDCLRFQLSHRRAPWATFLEVRARLLVSPGDHNRAMRETEPRTRTWGTRARIAAVSSHSSAKTPS